MTNAVYTKPGKTVSLSLLVYDDGDLVDSLTNPAITNIYKPNLTVVDGYPQNMIKIDTGIYIFNYTVPNHPSSIGNFIIDIEYTDVNSNLLNKTYQIIVQYSGLSGNRFGMISAGS